MFGKRIQHQMEDVTPTFLAPNILSTLRQADYLANTTLLEEGQISFFIHLFSCKFVLILSPE